MNRVLPNKFTIIDIETTGFSHDKDSITELALLKVEDCKIVHEYQQLINPVIKSPSRVTRITGITDGMVADAPLIKDEITKYVDLIGNDIIVGYNVRFDLNFINRELYCYHNTVLYNHYIDFLSMMKHTFPYLESHKLSFVADFLGVNTVGHHRALADCHILYSIYLKLKDETNIDYEIKSQSHKSNIDNYKLKAAVISSICSNEGIKGKRFAFTGELKTLSRKDAMLVVAQSGGICLNTVTINTDYLVIGSFANIQSVKGGKSHKIKIAENYIERGLNITILSEDDFIKMFA